VPRYKSLILGTLHPDTQYLREQEYEDPWSFFEVNRNQRAKILGNILNCDNSDNYKYQIFQCENLPNVLEIRSDRLKDIWLKCHCINVR